MHNNILLRFSNVSTPNCQLLVNALEWVILSNAWTANQFLSILAEDKVYLALKAVCIGLARTMYTHYTVIFSAGKSPNIFMVIHVHVHVHVQLVNLKYAQIWLMVAYMDLDAALPSSKLPSLLRSTCRNTFLVFCAALLAIIVCCLDLSTQSARNTLYPFLIGISDECRH